MNDQGTPFQKVKHPPLGPLPVKSLGGRGHAPAGTNEMREHQETSDIIVAILSLDKGASIVPLPSL